jgi:hypothetical protein
LQGLVGGSTEANDLERIWRDSLLECNSRLNQITFDSFKRLMKSQGKNERLALNGSRRGSNMAGESSRFMTEPSLDMVPEGLVLDSSLHMSEDEEEKSQALPSHHKKPRARSFDEKVPSWQQNFSQSESMLVMSQSLVGDSSKAFLVSAQGHDVSDVDDASSRMVNRAIYRRHRELRLAVVEASKKFDKMRAEIQNKDAVAKYAGLIMKRGAEPPVELEDAHRRALFAAAANRCGRGPTGRKTKTKTVSDVTGML